MCKTCFSSVYVTSENLPSCLRHTHTHIYIYIYLYTYIYIGPVLQLAHAAICVLILLYTMCVSSYYENLPTYLRDVPLLQLTYADVSESAQLFARRASTPTWFPFVHDLLPHSKCVFVCVCACACVCVFKITNSYLVK